MISGGIGMTGRKDNAMKVYVVMGGWYPDDMSIIRIFADEEKANQFVDEYSKEHPCCDLDIEDYNVEE